MFYQGCDRCGFFRKRMTSKWAQPDPEPVKHPPFVPRDVDTNELTTEQGYFVRLVRESLVIGYDRTPWNVAIRLQTRPEFVDHVLAALALVADANTQLRTYVRPGRVEKGKRVMVGMDAVFPIGKEPWGPAPVPAPAYSPFLTKEEFERHYQNDFPPPVNPE